MGQLGNHNGFQLTSRIEYQDKDEFPFPFPFPLSLPFAPVAQLLNPQPYAKPSNSRPFVVKLGGCTGIPFFIAFDIGSVSAKLSRSGTCTLANAARNIGSTTFRNMSLFSPLPTNPAESLVRRVAAPPRVLQLGKRHPECQSRGMGFRDYFSVSVSPQPTLYCQKLRG